MPTPRKTAKNNMDISPIATSSSRRNDTESVKAQLLARAAESSGSDATGRRRPSHTRSRSLSQPRTRTRSRSTSVTPQSTATHRRTRTPSLTPACRSPSSGGRGMAFSPSHNRRSSNPKSFDMVYSQSTGSYGSNGQMKENRQEGSSDECEGMDISGERQGIEENNTLGEELGRERFVKFDKLHTNSQTNDNNMCMSLNIMQGCYNNNGSKYKGGLEESSSKESSNSSQSLQAKENTNQNNLQNSTDANNDAVASTRSISQSGSSTAGAGILNRAAKYQMMKSQPKSKLTVATDTIGALREALAKIKANPKTSHLEMLNLVESYDKLYRQNIEKVSTNVELVHGNDVDLVQKLERENEMLRKKLDEDKTTSSSSDTDIVATLKSELKTKSDKVGVLEKSLASQKRLICTLRGELQQITHSMEKVEEEKQKLVEDNTAFQQNLTDYTKLKKELSDSQKKAVLQDRQINALKMEIDERKEMKTNLKQEVIMLKEALGNRENEAAGRVLEIENLLEEADMTVESLELKNRELEDLLEESQEELANARKNLDEVTQKQFELQRQLNRKEDELSAIRTSTKHNSHRTESTEKELNDEKLKIRDLQHRISQLHNDLDEQNRVHQECQRKLSDYELKNTQQQCEVRSLQREKEQLKATVHNLKQEVMVTKKNSFSKDQMDDIRYQINQFEEEKAKIQDQSEHLLKNADAEIQRLRQELASRGNDTDTSSQELTAKTRQIEDLTSKLRESELNVSALESALNEHKNTVTELRKEVRFLAHNMEEQLLNSQREMERLQQKSIDSSKKNALQKALMQELEEQREKCQALEAKLSAGGSNENMARELEEELRQSEQLIKELDHENQQNKTLIQSLQKDLADATNNNRGTSDDSDEDNEVDRLKMELNKSTIKVNNLENALSEQRETAATLRREMRHLTKAMGPQSSNHNTCDESNNNNSSSSDHNKSNAGSENPPPDSPRDIAHLQKELEEQRLINECQNDKISQLEEMLEEAEIQAYQEKRNNQMEKENHLFEMQSFQKVSHASLESSRNREHELEACILRLKDENQKLEVDLSTAFDEKERTEAYYRELVDNHTEKVKELEEILAERENIAHDDDSKKNNSVKGGAFEKAKDEQIQTLERALASKKETIQSLQVEIRQLAKSMEGKLLKSQAEIESLKKDKQQQQQQCDNSGIINNMSSASDKSHETTMLKKELKRTKVLLRESKLAIEQLERELTSNEEKYQVELAKHKDNTKKDLSSNALNSDQKDVIIQDLEDKLSSQKKQVSSLQLEIRKLARQTEEQLASNSGEMEKIYDESDAKSRTIAQQTQELKYLRKTVDDHQETNSKLKQNIVELGVELKNAQVKVEEWSDKINSVEEQLKDKDNRIDELSSENTNLNDDNTTLRDKLSSTEQEFSSHKQVMEEERTALEHRYQKDTEQYKRDQMEYKSVVSNLGDEISYLRDKLSLTSNMYEESNKLSQTKANLEHQNTNLQAELSKLRSERAMKDKDYQAVTKERDDFQSKMKKSKDMINTLENTVSSQKKLVTSLRAEVNNLSEIIEENEKELDNLSNVESKNYQLEEEINNIKNELQKAKNLVEQSHLAMAQLEKENFTEKETMQSKYETQMRDMKGNLMQQDEEMSVLKRTIMQQDEEMSALNRTITNMESEAQHLREHLAKSKADIDDLRRQLDSHRMAKIELEKDLTSELSELKNENEKLKLDLQNEVSSHATSRENAENFESQFQNSMTNITNLELKLSSQAQTVASLRSEIRRLSRQTEEQNYSRELELVDLQQECQDKSKKIQQQDEALLKIKVEMEEYKMKSNEYNDKESSLKQEMESLSDKHSQLNKDYMDVQDKYQASQKQVQYFETKQQSDKSKISSLEEKIAHQKQTVASLRSEFRALARQTEKQMLTSHKDVDTMQDKITQQDAQLEEFQSLITQLKEDLNDSNRRNQHLQTTIDTLELEKKTYITNNENDKADDMSNNKYMKENHDLRAEVENLEKQLSQQKQTVASLRSGTMQLVASTEEQLNINMEEMEQMHQDALRKARKLTKMDKKLKALTEERDFLKKTNMSLERRFTDFNRRSHQQQSSSTEIVNVGSGGNNSGSSRQTIFKSPYDGSSTTMGGGGMPGGSLLTSSASSTGSGANHDDLSSTANSANSSAGGVGGVNSRSVHDDREFQIHHHHHQQQKHYGASNNLTSNSSGSVHQKTADNDEFEAKVKRILDRRRHT